MKSIKIKYTFLSLMLLFASIMPLVSFNEAQFEQEMNKAEPQKKSAFTKRDDEGDCNVIKVDKLKADKAYVRCAYAKLLDAECVDVDHVRALDVSADLAYLAGLCTQTMCSGQIVANSVDAQTVTTNNLSVAGNTCLANLSVLAGCMGSFSSNDMCVSGTLKVNNLLNCGKYRASAVFSTNSTYTLGQPINWDLIIDDPDNDIILTPTFEYVVPVSGLYIVTLQVDQNTFQPFDNKPILGVPVSNPQLWVNGIVFRQSYVPYLTFFNQQKTTLTSLIHLNAGDVVTTVFDILADSGTPVAGTVSILGDGQEADQSIFKIALLNVDCIDLPCTPCTPTPCQPSTPLTCGPCTALTPCTPCGPCVPCQC